MQLIALLFGAGLSFGCAATVSHVHLNHGVLEVLQARDQDNDGDSDNVISHAEDRLQREADKFVQATSRLEQQAERLARAQATVESAMEHLSEASLQQDVFFESCRRPSDKELQYGTRDWPNLLSLSNESFSKELSTKSWFNPHGLLQRDGRPLVNLPGVVDHDCVKELPKILHFVWMGQPLKEQLAQNMIKFAKINPSYMVMLWIDNEKTIEHLGDVFDSISQRMSVKIIKDEAKNFINRDMMCQSKVWAGTSDLLRAEVVYLYGGIYVEFDTNPWHGFDDYGGLFRWPFMVAGTGRNCPISSTIFGFQRHSPFLKFHMLATRESCEKFQRCEAMQSAGPCSISASFQRWNSSQIALVSANAMINHPRLCGSECITTHSMDGMKKDGWFLSVYKQGIKQPDVGFCLQGESI